MDKLTLVFLLLMATIMTSCGQQNLPVFPQQIHTTKTSQHVRVAGTKVFGVFPLTYLPIKQLARYQKNDDLYVQVIENHSSSFEQAKSVLNRAAIEAKGALVDDWQATQVNGYDGIYMKGPSKHPDETKLMLAFGDNTFIVMVLGVAKAANKAGIEELKGIMRTIYYDASFQTDPMELTNSSFDQNITHFRYAQTISNMVQYAENGQEDVKNPIANSIFIMAFPKAATKANETFIESVLKNVERKGTILDDKHTIHSVVNGYPAYVIATTTQSQNKKGCFYLALLEGQNSNVVFYGTSFNDSEKYLSLFKRTAATLKIK